MTRNIVRAALASVACAAALVSATLSHAEDAPAAPVATAPQADAVESAPQAVAPVVQDGARSASPANRTASAQYMTVPPVDPGRWRFTIEPYLWMTSIESTVSFSPPIGSMSVITADTDASFTDVLGLLNFAIMGAGEARLGRASVQTDLIYVNLTQSGSRVRSVMGPLGGQPSFNLGGRLNLKTIIWTSGAGYDVLRGDHGFLELFGGFRYFGADATLDWNFQRPLADLARTGTVKASADVWDGVAGARGEVAFGKSRWKLVYYGDVGAGSSKLTWQTSAQLAYAKHWGDFGIGWRYLDYQEGSGQRLQSLRLSGPILVVRYRFGA